MNAAERIDRDDAAAGDIVACVGFKNSTTGDTLCAEGKEIVLEKIEFAKPVIDVAIEPKTKAEQDKMSLALTKLAEEDPTFRVSTNHETGQTIIAGMGELHLEIIVDRLLREFKVDANVGKPQVAYRETAGHDVEKAEGKFVRQSGGRGQYGHAVIKLEKMEEGFGYEFVNAIVGGVVPKEYIPSIDKGIQEALNTGVIAGFPVVDVKVTLFDGSYHEVDSSEAAFKIAGSMAIKDALKKSDPVSCSSRSWLSRSRPPSSTWATLWATSPVAAARSRAWRIARTASSSVPRCRWARCSVTLPTFVPRPRAVRSYTMQFDSYEPAPKSIVDEDHQQERLAATPNPARTLLALFGGLSWLPRRSAFASRATITRSSISPRSSSSTPPRRPVPRFRPIPLPTERNLYYVIRSPHGQGLPRAVRDAHPQAPHRHPRPHPGTVDSLMRLDLPAGVDIEIKL